MADDSHIDVIQQGVDIWNTWRKDNPGIQPELEGANLAECQLVGVDFSGARLLWANLSNANLQKANLRGAHISSANLNGADLRMANLSTSRIHKANFSNALLLWFDFRSAYLARTNLSNAVLWETVFINTDLTEVKGLDTCVHNGPSSVDHRTISNSAGIPKFFLLACGIPNSLANCMLSLSLASSSYSTSFISYSSANYDFVHKLYLDLLNAGVNSWLDSKELVPGVRILDAISNAVERQERLILVCSKDAINSEWVEDEITKAFAEERKRKKDIVIPIRVDDSILKTKEPWAQKLKDSRYIGDFCEWRNSNQYKESFNKLLAGLRCG